MEPFREKIIWTSCTTYVSLDTGEILPKSEIDNKNYIIIKTKKHATVNGKYGTINYTRECRKQPQQKLFTD